jgi:hypothetical protein
MHVRAPFIVPCAAVGFSIATVLVPAMFGAVSGVQVRNQS